MPASKNKMKYIAKYTKEKTRIFYLKFHKEKYKDVIDYLDSQPSKQGTILKALRLLMEKENNQRNEKWINFLRITLLFM